MVGGANNVEFGYVRCACDATPHTLARDGHVGCADRPVYMHSPGGAVWSQSRWST